MSYQIAQDFHYIGNDYWSWWAWIDAEDAELDKVNEVVWVLHPSFKRTRVRVKDRSSQFRLDTAGWGTFLLRAEVMIGDEKLSLHHYLRLEYPDANAARPQDKTPTAPQPNRRPTIYLSYSGQDARTASKLREQLTEAGVDVLDTTRLKPGEPWNRALQRMIAQADAVVGFVGEDEISPIVIDDLGAGLASEKPSLALLPEGSLGANLPLRVAKMHFNQGGPSVLPITDLLQKKKGV